MLNCGIYKIEFPDGRFYIGSSCNVPSRLKSHLNKSIAKRHENYRFQEAFNLHGGFASKILLICAKQDLLLYEQVYLDNFRPEINISPSAEKIELSPETRAKISKSRIGMKFSKTHIENLSRAHKGHKRNLGIKFSEEHKLNLSLAKRGKPGPKPSEETRAKLRAVAAKRKYSTETREKLRRSKLGNSYKLGWRKNKVDLHV